MEFWGLSLCDEWIGVFALGGRQSHSLYTPFTNIFTFCSSVAFYLQHILVYLFAFCCSVEVKRAMQEMGKTVDDGSQDAQNDV